MDGSIDSTRKCNGTFSAICTIWNLLVVNSGPLRSPSDRSESLDALRGLAISLVVACHYGGFALGIFGVDLFFVLSGFLIGGILLDSRDQLGYFSSFYGRRAFRILPLYWLLLLITRPYHWHYYLLFMQQLAWLQFGYTYDAGADVTWSLANEEQFYLMLPLLIAYLPRRWLVRLLWCGVLLAPVYRWTCAAHLPGHSWRLFLMPASMDELFGGVLLACYLRGYCRSPTLWAVLACVVPLYDVAYVVAFGSSAIPLSVVALICCAAVWSSTAANVPVLLYPLIWMGRRCYALYLFHRIALDVSLDLGLDRYAAVLAFLAVCVFAEISWLLIEAPLIGYARRRFVRAGTAAVATAAA
ncbi:hypothetical protein CK489_32665 [Bradyrhizobium sp. UFLA03-84]|uniref:acyltransferase family protein n=1 Tax=Bradyrhizobium sp. UFLA03-84 TaxID=418599 RepID=UPI000BAE47DF|nr:acyltransferase [Bradyrhizobium sp. UFLA03-84]PAY04045.1 hypothetical protein CK489_32665 [Bradyrhizobium sp. UFLA03-84]